MPISLKLNSAGLHGLRKPALSSSACLFPCQWPDNEGGGRAARGEEASMVIIAAPIGLSRFERIEDAAHRIGNNHFEGAPSQP